MALVLANLEGTLEPLLCLSMTVNAADQWPNLFKFPAVIVTGAIRSKVVRASIWHR
jgi:hypothetical protein